MDHGATRTAEMVMPAAVRETAGVRVKSTFVPPKAALRGNP